MDYYKEKYGITVQDQNQPLIITKDRRTGKLIVLLPELCDMTGLTDEHRANFNLMRDLAQV
jgi:aubergine-like protein